MSRITQVGVSGPPCRWHWECVAIATAPCVDGADRPGVLVWEGCTTRGLLRPPLYRLLRVPRLCQTEPEVASSDGKIMAVDRPIERQKSVVSASSSRESPPKMALRPRCCVPLVKRGSKPTSLTVATCSLSEMADARASPVAAAKTQATQGQARFIPEFSLRGLDDLMDDPWVSGWDVCREISKKEDSISVPPRQCHMHVSVMGR